MTKGMETLLWALGGVAVVGGVGTAVYFATRKKPDQAAISGAVTGGAAGGSASGTLTVPPQVFTLSQVAGGAPGSL